MKGHRSQPTSEVTLRLRLDENGFDAVLLMEARGAAVVGAPVRMRAHFHPRLGLQSPAPFMVRFDPAHGGFVRVDDEPEAA